MKINCPCCGVRSIEEFSYLGDATLQRPETGGSKPTEEWVGYVYLRDNPRGAHHEYWHHVGGCRAWLVVGRDTLTHDISETLLARDWRERCK